MESPGGNETSRQDNRLRAFAHQHRMAVTVATISIVSIAAIAPVIVQAARKGEPASTQPAASTQQGPKNAAEMQNNSSQNESHKTTVKVDNSTSSNSDNPNTNQSNTNVTVNGQSVEVPANGSYHKTIEDNNGRTEIHVDSKHSSSGDNNGQSSSNNSSVNLNVQSESHSESSSD
jgi:hypothetical protein